MKSSRPHIRCTISRGLWTCPPWVICASAFNHKIWNAAHSGVSEVLLFTKSYKWKKQRWKKWTTGRLLLETVRFLWSPTVRQFKMAARRMWAQKKLKLLHAAWQWSDYSLLFPCSISFAESFVTCLRNKAYVYLLTYHGNKWNPIIPSASNRGCSWLISVFLLINLKM